MATETYRMTEEDVELALKDFKNIFGSDGAVMGGHFCPIALCLKRYGISAMIAYEGIIHRTTGTTINPPEDVLRFMATFDDVAFFENGALPRPIVFRLDWEDTI